jgi:anthranilate phosphoribosyltransferase
MLKAAIVKVVEGKNLTREEASLSAGTIMRGEATPAQISALLIALRIKGETIDEITGFAEQMRAHSVHIHPHSKNLIDTCGTGGDVSHTFNISTVSALVAAGAGAKVAKHGNRSVSSKCGSADLLEAFGVKIDMAPEKVTECIDKIGFGFMFAPSFHPAMKHAGPVRREIGVRTIFNILGPLTNPADAKLQILGVYSPKLTEVMAEVLKNLGSERALVVHGMDGLDEISMSDKTKVSELKDGKIINYFIDPQELGIKKAEKGDLVVQNVEDSKIAAIEILEEHQASSRLEIVALNAAAALYLSGLAKDIKAGIELAKESINSGAAFRKLEELKHVH